MKSIRIHEHGSAKVLRIDDVTQPEPDSHEVRVKIKATSLNHMDIWVRNGIPGMGDLPLVLGCDASGEIEKTGSQVTGFKVGDRVFLVPLYSCGTCVFCENDLPHYCAKMELPGEHRNGTHQEFVCVPESHVIKLADSISFEEGASFPLTFLTAWEMLVRKAGIKAGQTILVMGANSGVGSAAIQIAKLFETKVIATASGKEKQDFAKNLGADIVIDHYNEKISKTVKEQTDGLGVDVVFEHIGEAVWQECLKSLKRGGKLVTCGATSGPSVTTDLRHLFIKQQQVIGSTMGNPSDLENIHELISYEKLKAPIGKTFHYTEIKEAHEFLENSKDTNHLGKVVLTWD